MQKPWNTRRVLTHLTVSMIIVLSAFTQIAQAKDLQQAKLLKKIQNWQVYIHETPTEKVCFAATQPKRTQPKNARRDPIYLYLTTWARDGVRNEISVKVGYPLEKGSIPLIIIGPETFELYPKNDRAFLHDPDQERKLLKAMKKGSSLIMKGTSARGTDTNDEYSLIGVTAALDELQKACP
jgi:invasion protein IalB